MYVGAKNFLFAARLVSFNSSIYRHYIDAFYTSSTLPSTKICAYICAYLLVHTYLQTSFSCTFIQHHCRNNFFNGKIFAFLTFQARHLPAKVFLLFVLWTLFLLHPRSGRKYPLINSCWAFLFYKVNARSLHFKALFKCFISHCCLRSTFPYFFFLSLQKDFLPVAGGVNWSLILI